MMDILEIVNEMNKFELLLVIFLSIFLFFINFFLKKFNLSLDKMSTGENHKTLLRLDNFTPLSGTYYYLPIIFILYYQLEFIVFIFCSLFFLIGLFADLKIVKSYNLRLMLQFLLLILLFFLKKDIIISTKINFLDNLMNYHFTRILICTFFFMVLINGFNLIDGTNCLCSLNFLIILFFIHLLINNTKIDYLNDEITILIIASLIFVVFNFFGSNFLGDGGAYGLGFLIGYILVKISIINTSISPYYVANLLWYPAFENLFSIIRRNFSNKNNYLPDNFHLHQLFYKYLKKKSFIKENYLLSSMVGIVINLILFMFFFVGYIFYNQTSIQVILILIAILLYFISYYTLTNKLK